MHLSTNKLRQDETGIYMTLLVDGKPQERKCYCQVGEGYKPELKEGEKLITTMTEMGIITK